MTNGISDIIGQLERQREAIDRAIAVLREVDDTAAPINRRGRPKKITAKRSKRVLSLEARERIGAAQRKRWRAVRKQTATKKRK